MSDQDDLVPGLVHYDAPRRLPLGLIGLVIVGVGILAVIIGLVIVGMSGGAEQEAITALATVGGALAGGISGWLIRGWSD